MNSSFSKKDTAAIKGIAILIMMLHHCFMQEKRFEGFTISFDGWDKASGYKITGPTTITERAE